MARSRESLFKELEMMCGSEELWEIWRTGWSLSALIIVFWYGWKFGLDEGLVHPLTWLMQGDTGSELYPRHMLGLAGDTGSEFVPGERKPGVKRGMLSCCFVSITGVGEAKIQDGMLGFPGT